MGSRLPPQFDDRKEAIALYGYRVELSLVLLLVVGFIFFYFVV